MGRKRTTNLHLPPRMHMKKGGYYHVSGSTPRKWTPLGADLNEARRKWAELESEPVRDDDRTFSVVARRYMKEVLPTLMPRTQRDYAQYCVLLEAAFGHVMIDSIRPRDIAEYLRIRGEKSKVRANREKALFSTIFNHARAWGYTDGTNPCVGVKGFREKARDRYVSDEEYSAVWSVAHPTVQDAMDLALYTGQRPADVLKIVDTDIVDGRLQVTQNKTGKKLRIALEGQLEQVVTRIMAKRRAGASGALLQDENGQPLTPTALRSRFDKARLAAGVDFQFRDLRAKAATDTEDLAHAQSLLGHLSRSTTEIYTRERRGAVVRPLKRKESE